MDKEDSKKNKKSVLILCITALFFVLIIIASFIFRNSIVLSSANLIADLAYETKSELLVKVWKKISETNEYRNQLTTLGIQVSDDESSYDILERYLNDDSNQSNIRIVRIENEDYVITVEPEQDIKILPGLALNQEIIILGTPGEIIGERKSLYKISTNEVRAEVLTDDVVSSSKSKESIVYKGGTDKNEVKYQALRYLNDVLEVETGNLKSSLLFLENTNEGELSDWIITDINLNDEIINSAKNIDYIVIGKVTLAEQPCLLEEQIDLLFSLSTFRYKISEDPRLFEKNCEGAVTANLTIQTCEVCIMALVDKTSGLPAFYEPDLATIVWNGQEQLIAQVMKEDLEGLLNNAKESGFSLNITSGYRSYDIQENTFGYWVDQELKAGVTTLEQAQNNANRYSAIPGFSEHQLGTTVDLNALGCVAFEGFCLENDLAWEWLAENAADYGFVLSYPENKEDLTGYIYEPWHYRWIGELEAKAYMQQGDTLNVWLANK